MKTMASRPVRKKAPRRRRPTWDEAVTASLEEHAEAYRRLAKL